MTVLVEMTMTIVILVIIVTIDNYDSDCCGGHDSYDKKIMTMMIDKC